MTILCTSRFRATAALSLPAGDSKPWNQICPVGEFPGNVSIPQGYDVPGYGIVPEAMEVEGLTVFNKEVLDRLVQTFRSGALVDYDHLSHDPDQSTEAAGWGMGLRAAADHSGLEMQTDWTPPARQKITDGIYRYISPEFSGAVRFEDGTFKFYPSFLSGAGLTNRPKLKTLKPVSANRETKTQSMNYKIELCKLLKLDPASATDAEIAAGITTEKAEPDEKNSDAKTKCRDTETITTLTAENKRLKDEMIESDIVAFADVITDKDAAKQLFQMNRELAVKTYTGIRTKLAETNPSGKAPVYQRNRATPPAGDKAFAEASATDEAATAKFRAVEARAQVISQERKVTFAQAFDAAKAELGA